MTGPFHLRDDLHGKKAKYMLIGAFTWLSPDQMADDFSEEDPPGGDILYNVCKAIINHPFGNGNHSTYLWNFCIDGSKSYKIIIFGGINIHISSYFRVPRVARF